MEPQSSPTGRSARGACSRSRPCVALGFGLLFFACCQLAMALTLDWWRPELRDPEYAAKAAGLRARLAACPGRPLVLVLGSSRCLMGLRPDRLPPCRAADGRKPVVYNASLLGAGPFLDLICLRRLLADGLRPDWLLLECWPASEIAEAVRIPVQRLTWADLRVLSRYTDHPDRLYREWAGVQAAPVWSYRTALMKRCAPDWLPGSAFAHDGDYPPDAGGWVACPFGTNPRWRRRITAQAHALHADVLKAFRHTEESDRALREILTLCRRERIAVALLVLPESSTFRDCYPTAVRAAVDDYLDRLAEDFQVPLIDARAWAADEDFADGYHLLPQAAAAFTARFGRQALQPVLQGRLPLLSPTAGERGEIGARQERTP